ncbi:MAG: PIN domain-containing protein [Coriobacteriales bacterium]|jgi:predicted nucleic acid-binding protein|nr:PIN domain-containing protein [Coriobacteriales bacterium]
MPTSYVLDACALIALLADEVGAEVVGNVLIAADEGRTKVYIHEINLLEVYYDVIKVAGSDVAATLLSDVAASSIEVIHSLSDQVFRLAGRLKAQYRISLADAIALSVTHNLGACLLSSDHHEFEPLQEAREAEIRWIR